MLDLRIANWPSSHATRTSPIVLRPAGSPGPRQGSPRPHLCRCRRHRPGPAGGRSPAPRLHFGPRAARRAPDPSGAGWRGPKRDAPVAASIGQQCDWSQRRSRDRGKPGGRFSPIASRLPFVISASPPRRASPGLALNFREPKDEATQGIGNLAVTRYAHEETESGERGPPL